MEKKVFERLKQYYRCPEQFAQFEPMEASSGDKGYFRLGEDIVCYGKYCGDQAQEISKHDQNDALRHAENESGTVRLPFDPSEVAENLLLELYVEAPTKIRSISSLAGIYYRIRPFLPVGIRRNLQKIYLAGWEKIPFPRWPVDFSVDNLYRQLLVESLRSTAVSRIPFIWFWPNGASSCSLMTHDVETAAGCRFCQTLMDIDDSFHIKSSFQIVPEERYGTSSEFLGSFRQRCFEINVHDLNHDGRLFENREQFLERAAKINAYGREFGAAGFRSAVLYRKQLWFDALDFSYDMSVPNVAHLDPQRGGCCTVMPYFIGNILEIPVTTTQDYTMFHILGDYSISLWKRQIDLIKGNHGLMSFIVHPDYIIRSREQKIYNALLSHLDRLRRTSGVWITTPAELNRWWRQRAEMTLVEEDGEWRIDGEGKDRGQVAFLSLKDTQIAVEFQLKEDQRSSSAIPTC